MATHCRIPCLKNPRDRGILAGYSPYGVAESQTQLSGSLGARLQTMGSREKATETRGPLARSPDSAAVLRPQTTQRTKLADTLALDIKLPEKKDNTFLLFLGHGLCYDKVNKLIQKG